MQLEVICVSPVSSHSLMAFASSCSSLLETMEAEGSLPAAREKASLQGSALCSPRQHCTPRNWPPRYMDVEIHEQGTESMQLRKK